jgi:hypothetical protein
MSLEIQFICKESHRDIIPEPVSADKAFPNWFAEMPKQSKCPFAFLTEDNIYDLKHNRRENVAGCRGIVDFLKLGYIIPSWDNFVFREDEDGSLYVNWLYSGEDTNYSMHLEDQYQTMPNKPLYGHFSKITTPWLVKTSPGVSCLVTHPVWHKDTPFTTSTGVFHTDKSPMELHWFFEWNYKIQSGMSLEDMDVDNQTVDVGDPIVLIIPFYRKNFSSVTKYVSSDEFDRLKRSIFFNTHPLMKFNDPYSKFRKTLGRMFK